MAQPDMTAALDGRLYHATSRAIADKVLAEGLSPHRSFWGVLDIAEYYAEVLDDEGTTSVILSAELAAFDEAQLEEDTPGWEEPITSVLGCSEADVHAAWDHDPRAWRASLDGIGSVVYRGALSAAQIREEA
ncbi:hypothetical protein [Erythrobacter aureus]|uniref:Uncharacterized protein n=1 Tax=Erythrobacter aureus TaxID=2182384 RepID=A0A345YIR3_9SPHN|nr:hypothetical protein [Erythrobacter aureus]AXK43815.1 hypothetical protein DVR09_15275 [Erythrobacter aureus]